MKKIIVCLILFLLIVPGMAWGQYSNVPRGSGGGTSLPADSDGYLKNTSGVLSWDTPAGAGDVTKVGTPTEHQQAVWTGDGTIKGVTVTGSKVMCTDANGEPVACTNLTDSRVATDLSITDQAAGDILYFNGTNWVRIAKGAANTLFGVDYAGVLKFSDSHAHSNSSYQFFDSTAGSVTNALCTASGVPAACCTGEGTGTCAPKMVLVDPVGITGTKTATLAFSNTDDATITFPAITSTLAILGANTFTALQTIDATAGLKVGSTGVLITSDNDGAITFTGASAGYDEDLTLNFDDTENTVSVSSSTGVTKVDFGSLNLATTGIVTGAVNTNADADGMSAANMTTAGMYGTMFWATGAGTWNLPGAATGMSFCVYSTTAAAIVINPDDGDTIVLNGTALSAGDSITSASGAGDFICLMAKDANTWYTLGRSGTWTDTN